MITPASISLIEFKSKFVTVESVFVGCVTGKSENETAVVHPPVRKFRLEARSSLRFE